MESRYAGVVDLFEKEPSMRFRLAWRAISFSLVSKGDTDFIGVTGLVRANLS